MSEEWARSEHLLDFNVNCLLALIVTTIPIIAGESVKYLSKIIITT